MVLIGRARGIWRQIAALTGVAAILVQAILFAWHHHAFPFHPHAASAATILAAPISPAMPAADDHGCQICFTLSHHGAVPVDFFWAKPPEERPLHQIRVAVAADPLLPPYLLFRSRAPPVA